MKISAKSICVALLLTLTLQAFLAFANRPANEGNRKNANSTSPEKKDHGANTEPALEIRNLQTPESLSVLFHATAQNPGSDETRSVAQQENAPKKQTEQETNHYFLIGIIKDARDVRYVYVKHSESGRVLRARLDGVAENGIRYAVNGGTECIEVKGIAYTIAQKDKK